MKRNERKTKRSNGKAILNDLLQSTKYTYRSYSVYTMHRKVHRVEVRSLYQGPAVGEARSVPRDWENRKRKRWTTTAGVPESNDVTWKPTEGLQVQKG